MKSAVSPLKKLNHVKIIRAAALTAAAIFFFSCAAVPEKAEMPSSAGLLPESVNVVISTRVDGNRELIEPVLEVMAGSIPEDMAEIFLDRTDRIWAGLELSPEAGDAGMFKSSIAAEGDFPKGMIEWGLCWNGEWNKELYKPDLEGNYEMVYWDSPDAGNQIALPSKDFILASSGDMSEMLGAWSMGARSASGEFAEAERAADVTIMTRGLSKEDYGGFVPELVRVPIESLVLSMKRTGGDYVISGRFHMDSAVNSFLFATIFRTLVITAKTPDGKRRFTNLKEIVIKQEDSDVILEGLRISAEEAVETEIKWLSAAGVGF